MTVQKSIVSAAIAGVYAYLQSEKEQAEPESEMTPQALDKAGPAALPVPGNLWAASGRIFSMQIRNLMQFRAFRKP
jgi:hypothetical protein